MKHIVQKENIIISPDRIIFIIVSLSLFGTLTFLGSVILLYTTTALHIIAFFLFIVGAFPILTWKKYFYRKVVLSKDMISILSDNQQLVYHISDVKAITIGVHVVFYFKNGRRFVIRYCHVSKDDIISINPSWPCFKYNGDLRFRIYQNIASGIILLLFSFCFVTGVDLTYTLLIIAIIGLLYFCVFFANYLFFD